jgi:dCTP deaminase
MILSGHEIQAELGRNIVIDPFDPSRLNPNSYNLSLHDELIVYEEVILDMRKPNRYRRIKIPAEGLVLHPSQLYLGRTAERTETHNLVPMIEGRSSIAVQPVRIYAGVAICQIIYHDIRGPVTAYQSDKYQHNTDIQPSMLFKELDPDWERDLQKKLPLGWGPAREE